MGYVEMSTDEAIEVLKRTKGKRVLVAIKNLEDDNDAIFYQKLKSECEIMIKEAQTISSVCDEFVKKLDLFTSKQNILDIKNLGLCKTILLNE